MCFIVTDYISQQISKWVNRMLNNYGLNVLWSVYRPARMISGVYLVLVQMKMKWTISEWKQRDLSFSRKFSFSGFIFFNSDDFKEKSPWQIKKSNETPIPIFFIHNIPWKHHFAWRYDILFCSAWFWFVCVFWLKCMVGIPNTQKMVDVSSLASSSFLIYFADFPVNDLKVNHHCTSLN